MLLSSFFYNFPDPFGRSVKLFWAKFVSVVGVATCAFIGQVAF